MFLLSTFHTCLRKTPYTTKTEQLPVPFACYKFAIWLGPQFIHTASALQSLQSVYTCNFLFKYALLPNKQQPWCVIFNKEYEINREFMPYNSGKSSSRKLEFYLFEYLRFLKYFMLILLIQTKLRISLFNLQFNSWILYKNDTIIKLFKKLNAMISLICSTFFKGCETKIKINSRDK